ncbi:hypothetical protein HZH66_008378 [Vespula vulgaris]|uniref:Uncharacterized protein n=1 Tax=Vespula vulgaris TaxID=7454 RepID=A0A834JR30_VESVU|nr:hypothetical protein HZH66_008378 [Vespula vulgaris]
MAHFDDPKLALASLRPPGTTSSRPFPWFVGPRTCLSESTTREEGVTIAARNLLRGVATGVIELVARTPSGKANTKAYTVKSNIVTRESLSYDYALREALHRHTKRLLPDQQLVPPGDRWPQP